MARIVKCAACGHVYDETDVPLVDEHVGTRKVFTEEDKSDRVEVFRDAEKNATCRHCEHYLINPFTQRCGLHFHTVEATDSCDDFTLRTSEESVGE